MMNDEQLVLFRLGTEEYAIPITKVKEIIQYQGATPLPNSQYYLEGIINLRGRIIPVVDLAKKMELTSAERQDKRALIIETAGHDIGAVVDEVTEVIRLTEEEIDLVPSQGRKEYIRGIGKQADRLLILLEVDNLFFDERVGGIKQ